MDFLGLAQKYGTPLYVYDMEKIKANFLDFKQAFAGRKSLICYALKANSNLSILSLLAQCGSGADCVSIYEVKRALLAGIPKYKIIFSGVGKKSSEIKEALELDILFINVESQAELMMIEQIASSLQKVARISIRVNPNIDAKTHPYISTGLSENKFGVDMDLAKQMYLYAYKSSTLEPIGIHFHIGSQLTDLSPISQSTQKIAELARSLVALGVDLRFFDVGGGVGICYENEQVIALYDYAQSILKALNGLDLTIICEPGRRIVGEAGYLLSSVLYEKSTPSKRFVIVDAGMNDLLRPALYGAYHTIQAHQAQNQTQQNKSTQDEPTQSATKADIVGPVCESADVFGKDIVLPPLRSGDILSFGNAGAYGYSMSSHYNARMRPAEVGVFVDGECECECLLKPRESFEDSVAEELKILHSHQATQNRDENTKNTKTKE
ncbi:diaminopimelate decarboxylase [Helicobacter fennelliae]|uniref:Diaminopimelate decarboxylase n=3 Tax=Helicobacter fennelliae TaxID=215 RepID=T1DVY1_9HELI|nr:diaminopimelate decarboxylase [Helicobacter fennelliae]GAD19153.1 diaminopimelate decarboxylase [Helicobacter fennelliae MRY12-0050]STP08228.1 diaminopimelate decarboxylase [Helicobacter fennelliae]STQ84639.1 diaminopimelate decarboxylase [Helicobacter fennelliae]